MFLPRVKEPTEANAEACMDSDSQTDNSDVYRVRLPEVLDLNSRLEENVCDLKFRIR